MDQCNHQPTPNAFEAVVYPALCFIKVTSDYQQFAAHAVYENVVVNNIVIKSEVKHEGVS